MKTTIQRVIDRNVNRGNPRGSISDTLEAKLLHEEAQETWRAIRSHDTKEVIDGCCDVMSVAIGTLHKLGLSVDQIDQALNIVCDSNDTKISQKDENGKIKKGKSVVLPDFSHIMETLETNWS